MSELFTNHLLTILIFLPLIGAGLVALINAQKVHLIRAVATIVSLATLLVAIVVLVHFGRFAAEAGQGFCLVENVSWLGGDQGEPLYGVDLRYHVGVDGLSIFLVVLGAVLLPLTIIGSFSAITTRVREYYALLLLLGSAMLGVFCARDLLLFYVFFEFTLIPLYLLIGIWGSTDRRRAATRFFMYTIAGSVLSFAGILYLAWIGSSPLAYGVLTFDIDKLASLVDNGLISLEAQKWLFLALLAGFAIKVPLFPVHTWLPLAHTEAPAAGSVVLAGVLLKLGTYGFMRFCLPLTPDAAVHFAPMVAGVAVVGIIYGAVAAWVQQDFKKLVAYSSVSHLGFCMLGMFALQTTGLTGSLLYMVNHGLSTGALFFVIGMIYERYHTRQMGEVAGLAKRMPVMAFFLIFFSLSSIGLPGLNGFVSEFLVLVGTFTSGTFGGPLSKTYAIVAATGVVLSAVYMLWMCQRVLFGPLVEPAQPAHAHNHNTLPVDLSRREVLVLAPLAVLVLVLGVYPKPVLNVMNQATAVIAADVNRSGPGVPRTRLADQDIPAGKTDATIYPGEHGLDVARTTENASSGMAEQAEGQKETVVRITDTPLCTKGVPACLARR